MITTQGAKPVQSQTPDSSASEDTYGISPSTGNRELLDGESVAVTLDTFDKGSQRAVFRLHVGKIVIKEESGGLLIGPLNESKCLVVEGNHMKFHERVFGLKGPAVLKFADGILYLTEMRGHDPDPRTGVSGTVLLKAPFPELTTLIVPRDLEGIRQIEGMLLPKDTALKIVRFMNLQGEFAPAGGR